mmetsp:Transcript_43986/g.106082  ORF Transcript_43986/g.106082 Transcript_43986/m.106082 type:complete len:289 (+) Transcript_43986:76-942(+)
MQLKEQRSLRGMRSIQPFINDNVSKSLRGMRSIGRSRSRTRRSKDPATADSEGSSSSDSSVASLEFDLDVVADKRDPPSPKVTGKKKKNKSAAHRVKPSAKKNSQPEPTLSKVGQEKEKSKIDQGTKPSKSDAHLQSKKINKGAQEAEKSSIPSHAPVLAAGAAAAAALQSNEIRASSDDRMKTAVEKYYSKLDAAKQKQEEDRDYLFDDIPLSATTMDYDEYTAFSDITGVNSRTVDIDDAIELDELKRGANRFGDDMASIDSTDTGISHGEEWGTGVLDCVLLLCV